MVPAVFTLCYCSNCIYNNHNNGNSIQLFDITYFKLINPDLGVFKKSFRHAFQV